MYCNIYQDILNKMPAYIWFLKNLKNDKGGDIFRCRQNVILHHYKTLTPCCTIFHLHSKSLANINSISETLTFKWIRIHIHKHRLSPRKSWFIQRLYRRYAQRTLKFPHTLHRNHSWFLSKTVMHYMHTFAYALWRHI